MCHIVCFNWNIIINYCCALIGILCPMDFDDFGDLFFDNESCVLLPLAKLPEYKPKYCSPQVYKPL